MKKMLYFLLLILFFIYCGQNKKIEIRYSDLVLHNEGKKFIFRTFTDSLNLEHVEVFSSEGNLDVKYRLFNDLKNGIEYGYYNSGNLKYKANFFNDTLQGKSKWYYDNKSNMVKYIYNYVDGIVAGNQITFDENSSMKRYFSNTYDKEVIYIAEYDNNGTLMKEKGKYKTFGEFNSKDFRTDKSIIYRGFFSNPDHVLIDYSYSISKLDEEDIWRKIKLLNSKVIIDTTISSSGKYIFKEKLIISRKHIDSLITEFYDFPLNIIE